MFQQFGKHSPRGVETFLPIFILFLKQREKVKLKNPRVI